MNLFELFVDDVSEDISDFLNENATMAWGKSGGKIVKKYRCKSGPRAGRLVSEPAQCSRRVDPEKRLKMRKLMARIGKKIARKAKKTKRVDPLSKQLKFKNAPLYAKRKVNEANVIGYAIHKKEIPEKYRGKKIIGRGATSIVFEDGPDHVIMLVRDAIKSDWLHHSDFAQYIETIDTPYSPTVDQDIDVYRIERMYPLNAKNKKIVKFFFDKTSDVIYNAKHSDGINNYHKYINKLVEITEEYFSDHESIVNFVNFIMDYSKEQYSFDFLIRNFMQDKNGKIIATDPVVSMDIINFFRNKTLKNRW